MRRARLSLFLLLRRQGTGGHCSISSSRYAGLRLACARHGLAAHCPLPSHQDAAAAASAAADAVVAAQTAADSSALAAAFAMTLSAALDADPNGAGENSATQVRGARAWSVVASPCPANVCLAASALPQSYAAAFARGGVSVSVSNMTTSGSGGSAAGSSAPSSSRALSGGAVSGIVVSVLTVVFAAAALNLIYQESFPITPPHIRPPSPDRSRSRAARATAASPTRPCRPPSRAPTTPTSTASGARAARGPVCIPLDTHGCERLAARAAQRHDDDALLRATWRRLYHAWVLENNYCSCAGSVGMCIFGAGAQGGGALASASPSASLSSTAGLKGLH